jgi:hypothetical protein
MGMQVTFYLYHQAEGGCEQVVTYQYIIDFVLHMNIVTVVSD